MITAAVPSLLATASTRHPSIRRLLDERQTHLETAKGHFKAAARESSYDRIVYHMTLCQTAQNAALLCQGEAILIALDTVLRAQQATGQAIAAQTAMEWVSRR